MTNKGNFRWKQSRKVPLNLASRQTFHLINTISQFLTKFSEAKQVKGIHQSIPFNPVNTPANLSTPPGRTFGTTGASAQPFFAPKALAFRHLIQSLIWV